MRLTRFILAFFLCGAPLFGQDAPPAAGLSVADERAAASEEASELLAELTCRVNATQTDASPDSILNWSNPDVGRVYGDVFLWLEHGRPAAAASIYRWFHPFDALTIEFSSLSPAAVAAERKDEEIWRTEKSGIEWQPVSDVRQPSRSRALRLTQLKRIARRFSAELTDTRTDNDGIDKVLRLLPQPLYRYPEQGGGTDDGALFAMVVGTDPELLLLVETDGAGWQYAVARMNRDGAGWQYAVARMNRDATDVLFDGERVRSFPYIADQPLFDASHPYCCVVVDDRVLERNTSQDKR